MRNIAEFSVIYDRASDVLYITTPCVDAEQGVEDEFGLVWRYDWNGRLLGCTIVDFSEHWYPERRHQLADLIAKNLELPLGQTENILANVIDTEKNA
jgi:hypothetical protein